MQIADVKIGQELVYRSQWSKTGPGPRIRVTEIQRTGTEEVQISYRGTAGRIQWVPRDRIIGIVLDPMGQPWPVDSQFLGLVTHFGLPVDTPEGE